MNAYPDPLTSMILRFQVAEALLDGSGDEAEPIISDFRAAYGALKAAPPATSKQGAVAALRLLLSELEHSEDPELATSLVGAVVAFLDDGSGVS